MHQRVKILVSALEMISDERHWAKGVSAVDSSGAPVKATDRRAVAWCAVGALERAAGDDSELFESCLEFLREASLQLFRCDPAVINDRTNHAGLVEMYTRAIQLASRNRDDARPARVSAARQRRPAAEAAYAQGQLRLVTPAEGARTATARR
jgi:hypothetical protein